VNSLSRAVCACARFCRVNPACADEHEHGGTDVTWSELDGLRHGGHPLPTLARAWGATAAAAVADVAAAGALVAAASETETRLIRAEDGQTIVELSAALCVTFVGGGAALVCGGRDGRVRAVDTATGAEVFAAAVEAVDAAQGPEGAWIECVVECPDAPLFAVAAGRSVTVVNSSSWAILCTLPPLPKPCTALAFLSGDKVAATCYGGVHVSSALGVGSDWSSTRAYKGALVSLGRSPTAEWLVAGSLEPCVRVWRSADESYALEMSGYSAKVQHLAWAADGRLATGGASQQPMVWDGFGAEEVGPSGRVPVGCFGHTRGVSSITFQTQAHDRKPLLASGARDGLVLAWNPREADDGVPRRCAPLAGAALGGRVSKVVWAGDDESVLVAGSSTGTLCGFCAPSAQ